MTDELPEVQVRDAPSLMTNQELIDYIRAQDRQERRLVAEFIAAAYGDDVDAAYDAFRFLVDEAYLIAPALRRLGRGATISSPEMQAMFLQMWIESGDHIRGEGGNDRTTLDAMRVMLPPYRGPDMVVLYRGESAWNRKHRKYGMSWTRDLEVARSFARMGICRTGGGGSVLLAAQVPAAAIISEVHKTDGDRFLEAEYLVDRRKLKRIDVLERYAQRSQSGRRRLADGQA